MFDSPAIPARRPTGALGPLPQYAFFRWGRATLLVIGVIVALVILLLAALVGILLVPTHRPPSNPVTAPVAAVQPYYLALGDSLAFGFQPNFDWDQSYAAQWWAELQTHGSRNYANYACSGETTREFISGGCPFVKLRHSYYGGSQLDAALMFIHDHPGQVGPVSLDIGADDMLPDVNEGTCTIDQNKWNADLARVDHDLTGTILPKLTSTLKDSSGKVTGQLVMMNYYDPFHNKCPNATHNIQQLNQHLADDAKQFNVPIADVFQAFGGTQTPNPHLCDYTWMCHSGEQQSIHPTTQGYKVIAQTFENVTGY